MASTTNSFTVANDRFLKACKAELAIASYAKTLKMRNDPSVSIDDLKAHVEQYFGAPSDAAHITSLLDTPGVAAEIKEPAASESDVQTFVAVRMGDFYEFYGTDAEVVAKALNITLTNRGERKMAGVPFHSVEKYRTKLADMGFMVELSDGGATEPAATELAPALVEAGDKFVAAVEQGVEQGEPAAAPEPTVEAPKKGGKGKKTTDAPKTAEKVAEAPKIAKPTISADDRRHAETNAMLASWLALPKDANMPELLLRMAGSLKNDAKVYPTLTDRRRRNMIDRLTSLGVDLHRYLDGKE